MKIYTKVIVLLSTLIMLAACNFLTPSSTPPSASSIEEVVTPTQITDEEAILAALAAHLGAIPNVLNLVIDQNTGTHARGGVDNGYFLAAKVNGSWVIVADGQTMPDCDAVGQYDFPVALVPECASATESSAESDEDAIRAALGTHLGIDGNTLRIDIVENIGSHARGGVDNGYFLAAKVNENWVIVADGQAMPDCNAVAQYGFPISMVPECSNSGSNMPDCPGPGVLAATFIADVTYPDGSLLSPGTGFVKTWRVKNVGTCTWNGDYQLVFDSGDVMSGPSFQRLTSVNVPPGKTLDVSINLTAPRNAGTYRGNWRFRAPNGVVFGLTTGNPIWVEVQVESPRDSIRAALAAHLGANPDDLRIVIDQNTGTHARGGVDNGYFLAVMINGQWRIVADGQAMPNCQIVAQYDFPPSMVPECQGSNVIDVLWFKPGGTYTFAQNSIGAGEWQTYQIRAMANQTLIVSVASDQNDVFVGINGIQGGQQLLSTNTLTGHWTGKLPQTQDYALTLTTNNPDTNYFMAVEIPANIRFVSGANSTVVDGHIEIFDPTAFPSVDNHVTYLLYASAGQTMDVQLSSPHLEALSLGVYGKEDGQPYQRYQVKNNGFYSVLPLTQGYYLKVFSNGTSTDFTLKITIV